MSELFPRDAAPGSRKSIADGIVAINAPFWGFPNVVYALFADDRITLIDSGVSETPEIALDAFIHEHGGYDAIDYVLGTHAHLDHIGGNGWIAERSSTARFAVGAKDVGWTEDPDRHYAQLYVHGCPGHWRPDAAAEAQIRKGIGAGVAVDVPLYDGETIRFGARTIRAVSLGSHTPGQMLYIDEATGCAFSGDAIQGAGVLNDAGFRDFPMFGNVRDYRAALQRIRESGFERLCTAHAGVFDRGAGEAFIDDALAFADALGEELGVLARNLGSFSLEQFVDAYLEKHSEYASALQIRVTLSEFANDLVADGVLVPALDGVEKTWVVAD
jgi:glyoxylase-like metal-dependent hydrolase (beta-lactamase superfamily II)